MCSRGGMIKLLPDGWIINYRGRYSVFISLSITNNSYMSYLLYSTVTKEIRRKFAK